jgi:exosortase
MFPIPEAFLTLFSFPLKKIVTESSVIIINIIGIPALREGFHISIPAGELVVGNPCSGLRSMIAFFALGALFAYEGKISLLKKWLLFFSAIPAAIISNIIRVLMLILVSHVWGISAASPDTIWHSGTGMLIFILALLLMFGFAKILGWKN